MVNIPLASGVRCFISHWNILHLANAKNEHFECTRIAFNSAWAVCWIHTMHHIQYTGAVKVSEDHCLIQVQYVCVQKPCYIAAANKAHHLIKPRAAAKPSIRLHNARSSSGAMLYRGTFCCASHVYAAPANTCQQRENISCETHPESQSSLYGRHKTPLRRFGKARLVTRWLSLPNAYMDADGGKVDCATEPQSTHTHKPKSSSIHPSVAFLHICGEWVCEYLFVHPQSIYIEYYTPFEPLMRAVWVMTVIRSLLAYFDITLHTFRTIHLPPNANRPLESFSSTTHRARLLRSVNNSFKAG